MATDLPGNLDVLNNTLNLEVGDSWATYDNDDYHFQIKFPDSMNLDAVENEFFLNDRKEDVYPLNRPVTITVISNVESMPLHSWLANEHSRSWFKYYDSRSNFIGAEASIIGIKMKEEGDPDHFNYYFASPQYVYRITSINENYENVIRTFRLK